MDEVTVMDKNNGNFTCNQCLKQFSNTSILKKHMKIIYEEVKDYMKITF